MFKPTAGRLDINSLLVNIYIYRQVCWERGNIHCVRPLGRMHTILVGISFRRGSCSYMFHKSCQKSITMVTNT